MIHTLTITPNGETRLLFDDDVYALAKSLGPMKIVRASHIEPDNDGRWWVDLSPMNGPKVGPFEVKVNALAFEREWLEVRL